jgi:hypothetical protein
MWGLMVLGRRAASKPCRSKGPWSKSRAWWTVPLVPHGVRSGAHLRTGEHQTRRPKPRCSGQNQERDSIPFHRERGSTSPLALYVSLLNSEVEFRKFPCELRSGRIGYGKTSAVRQNGAQRCICSQVHGNYCLVYSQDVEWLPDRPPEPGCGFGVFRSKK